MVLILILNLGSIPTILDGWLVNKRDLALLGNLSYSVSLLSPSFKELLVLFHLDILLELPLLSLNVFVHNLVDGFMSLLVSLLVGYFDILGVLLLGL